MGALLRENRAATALTLAGVLLIIRAFQLCCCYSVISSLWLCDSTFVIQLFSVGALFLSGQWEGCAQHCLSGACSLTELPQKHHVKSAKELQKALNGGEKRSPFFTST